MERLASIERQKSQTVQSLKRSLLKQLVNVHSQPHLQRGAVR